MTVIVNNKSVTALIDSGCSKTVVLKGLIKGNLLQSNEQRIVLANGDDICVGISDVELTIDNRTMKVECSVMKYLPYDLGILIGMDVISELGGVKINKGVIEFGVCVGEGIKKAGDNLSCVTGVVPSVSLNKHNYEIEFKDNWTVKWKWKDEAPSYLPIRHSTFKDDKSKDIATMKILEEWMKKGYLIDYDEKEMGKSIGSIPIFGILQVNKSKIRPIFDFRKLNNYVDVYSGSADICLEKLRTWRRKGSRFSMLDLSEAYMQIRVHKEMWRYQSCIINGKKYALTRMGFGLNIAPTIMTEIVKWILNSDPRVRENTDSYIDDIYVYETTITVDEIRMLFEKFSLKCKKPENLSMDKEVRVLGVKVFKDKNSVRWMRDNHFKDEIVAESISRRELYSLCGQLVGIHPVAGWLRPSCSYMKRLSEGKWDEKIDVELFEKIKFVLKKVKEEDPCRGIWSIDDCKDGIIWCDASSIAIGAALEVKGNIIEDASWLRKTDDSRHINVAELEAVVKGLNLCIKWGLTNVVVKSDNKSVVSWITEALSERNKLHTKASSELLIKRRLSMIKELCQEYEITLKIEFVNSEDNKADELTRIPKQLKRSSCLLSVTDDLFKLQKLHDRCHLGAKRMRYLCDKLEINVSNADIKDLISKCQSCQSIDPAPIKWETGKLAVNENWTRLAADVTKFDQQKFLSIIDCGPSRFAVWKLIKAEDVKSIVTEFSNLFCERGSPKELIIDNYTTFHSAEFSKLMEKWNVHVLYRAINRPNCNGIIERNHKTIKRIASRSNISIMEALWWYNNTPSDGKETPSSALYKYIPVGLEIIERIEKEPVYNKVKTDFVEQQLVWVKPENNMPCTKQWTRGVVVRKLDQRKYLINCDGFCGPRHIADIRPRQPDLPRNSYSDYMLENNNESASSVKQSESGISNRPQRERRKPNYLNEYVVDIDSCDEESGGSVTY